MVRRIGRSPGFTLIEMGIVLVVIGLVTAGGASAIGPIVENSKIAQTNQKLDRIEQALVLHIIRYGCLPCPAVGSETYTAGDADLGRASTDAAVRYASGCQSADCLAVGVVPWVNLGLSEADITDGFGTRITFQLATVTAPAPRLQDTNGMVRTPPSTYPVGNIPVQNAGATALTSEAAYVLLSHGPNRSDGYQATTGAPMAAGTDANEVLNAGGATYVQDDRSQTFDDIVRWRTAPLMIQFCGTNSCGNPV
jgi:prepilin-type N-terminal cleavage/methylation domain-containing protein